MELLVKYLPFGNLPYENVSALAVMQSRLIPWCPYMPILPKLEPEASVLSRTLSGFTSFQLKKENALCKYDKNYITQLDVLYNAPTLENTKEYRIQSPFKEEFLKIIKRYKSPSACVNLYGPFSLSRIIRLADTKESLDITDKMMRKVLIQTVVIKALSIIYEIKDASTDTTPIIIFEEPHLNMFSVAANENPEITAELMVSIYSKIIETLHNAGAKVAVRSMNKCNWKIPINAGADMISFDACRNPHNLCIIADDIKKFIISGGQLNYAIIPVRNEKEVQKFNPDYIYKKLSVDLEALVNAGVPKDKLFSAVSVSFYGEPDHLSLFFAEKASMAAVNFAKKFAILRNLYH